MLSDSCKKVKAVIITCHSMGTRLYGITIKPSIKRTRNYLFNATHFMRILSYVVFMRMFKIGIHSVLLKGILH